VRPRVVLTDLDGTLLEPDGKVVPEAIRALQALASAGVPVCTVTSKTAAELAPIMAHLGLATPAGFENGAGVRRFDGDLELAAAAVPLPELEAVFSELRRRTSAPVRSIMELGDDELAALTGLDAAALPAARARSATLPLVVEPSWDGALLAALPVRPCLRLIRGNRFLHLQGEHCKADVAPRLVELAGRSEGEVVGCGDAPNDAELLMLADLAVIIPGRNGANPELVRRVPAARVALQPHGRGWATVMTELLAQGQLGEARVGVNRRPATAGRARD
jgi:mannosyl-3-phosphoglycerate phosphatase